MHCRFFFFSFSQFSSCTISLQKNGRDWKSTVSERSVSTVSCLFLIYFLASLFALCCSNVLQRIANCTTRNIRQPAAGLINIVSHILVFVQTNDRVERAEEKENITFLCSVVFVFVSICFVYYSQMSICSRSCSRFMTHSFKFTRLENMGIHSTE